MEFEFLGTPPDAPTLNLDHERFAYAGKFVQSRTGKAVARDPAESSDASAGGTVVAATSFSEDYDAEGRVRIRYVTVREDRRGEGIGPRLLRFTAERLTRRYDDVAIAVNNPIAYRACYRAGFVSTGRETGIAEVLLRYDPGGLTPGRYREGFAVFEERDLPASQQSVLERHADGTPPPVVDVPGE